MTGIDPPRLAVALLRRLLHDNEPLAGDLIERFATGRSRLWFWRQVLLAIGIHSFQQRDVERPLGLAEPASFVPAEGRRNVRWRPVNLTASPLPGIGGLGLVAFGVLVALARPAALEIFLPAIAGGVIFGLTMAIIRRRAVLSSPAAGSRTLLRDADDVGQCPEERGMAFEK